LQTRILLPRPELGPLDQQEITVTTAKNPMKVAQQMMVGEEEMKVAVM